MRILMLATAGAAFVLAGAANAQAPSAQSPSTERAPAPPPASSPQAPGGTPAIKSVNVIELDELTEATKTQVNEIVAKRTPDESQRLQNAIENAPAVKMAVEAKGFSARDVLIAQVNDQGELIVVTRRAG